MTEMFITTIINAQKATILKPTTEYQEVAADHVASIAAD